MRRWVSKQTCKYTCSFTHIVVEASSVCTEDDQNDVSKVCLCVVIFEKNFGPHKAPRRTGHIWTQRLASRPSLNTCGIGLLCQLICNMPLCRCLNPLRCFLFDSETAYELISHAKPPLPFGKCAAQHNSNNTISTNRNLESLRNTWWKCFFPLPKNRYSAVCSNGINFYDPNSPFHLLNARLN